MFAWGVVMTGLVVTLWFRFLSQVFPGATRAAPATLVAKVAVNQAVMSPFLNTLFFGWVILTRDRPNSSAVLLARWRTKLAADLRPTILRSLVFWSSLNFCIFGCLPLAWHVFATSIGFFVWTSYVSFVGFRKPPALPS